MTPQAILAIRRFAPRAPLAAPSDLTLPEAGSTTVRDLLNRYLAAVLRDTLTLPAARLPRPRAFELERMQGIIADLATREPGAIVSLLRRPTFSVLVRCLTAEIARTPATEAADALAAELVETALLELAWMGVLEHPVVLDRSVRRLVSLAHDFSLDLEAPALGARFDAHGAELQLADGERLRVTPDRAFMRAASARVAEPFPLAFASAKLALRDNNPLSLVEAHPDKDGNAVELGGKPIEDWLSPLRQAFELVERYLPGIAAEMRMMLHQIVPVGFDAERHLSASYAEAIGTVYMSLHPNLLTMTEALIHEFQHNKLNALLYFDPVLQNLESELYASPVRPDPRPLRGVLLAVHAFQPVARLYEAMIEADDPLATPDARRRFRAVVEVNRDGCDVLLPNARPTDIGRNLIAEIARLHEHFGGQGEALESANLPPR